jgi:predicted ester cyclase
MPQEDFETELGRGLVRIGEEAIARENEAAMDRYFTSDFCCHTPEGDLNLAELTTFQRAFRRSLEELSVTRHDLLVKGDYVASRTRFSGVFSGAPFETPYGTREPNGRPVALEIINFFRFRADGRLAEEWAMYDPDGFYRQLGAVPR